MPLLFAMLYLLWIYSFSFSALVNSPFINSPDIFIYLFNTAPQFADYSELLDSQLRLYIKCFYFIAPSIHRRLTRLIELFLLAAYMAYPFL